MCERTTDFELLYFGCFLDKKMYVLHKTMNRQDTENLLGEYLHDIVYRPSSAERLPGRLQPDLLEPLSEDSLTELVP